MIVTWATVPCRRLATASLVLLASTSVAADDGVPFIGPDSSALDIVRPSEGFPRIYVQLGYPDGSTGLFLVDTGADISAMHRHVAERLGLAVQEGWSTVEGLSGRTDVAYALLPELQVGEMLVPQVEFAVGLRGMPESVDFMPIDGLIGNNVWSRFVLEIDYPADLLVVHRPGSVRLPRRQEVLFFDGNHVFSPVTLTTAAPADAADAGRKKPAEGVVETIIAQVDTGAGQLTLCAATGLPFQHAYTEGLEEMRGIGASETLPPYRFLETTRRIDIARVALGGRDFKLETSARWIDFDQLHTDECQAGSFKALLGHEYLAQHRVFFDYHRARLALAPSRRPKRSLNGHQVLLDQDLAAYGDDPARASYRAKLMVGANDPEGARALLTRAVNEPASTPEEAGERWVLLARLHRHFGDLAAAYEAVRHLPPADLVDQGEIVATVNGLLFDDRVPEARALADAAVAARPDEGDAHVALADVLLWEGDAEAANTALLRAAELEQFPDAHLLRRARVALAGGDRYGAMAHVRKLLQLYPFGGEFLWFYALLLQDDRDAETFRFDMDQAMGRLHPGRRPIDFQIAALGILGEAEPARALMQRGIEEHCDPMEDAPTRDNCVAWFEALAVSETDDALHRIERALASEGPRSDFLDTKAMVHLARGELEAAHASAWAAARMSPDDVYMLWQAERIGDLLHGDPKVSARPSARADAAAVAPD